jgi:hypothetical protein
LVEKWVVSRVE